MCHIRDLVSKQLYDKDESNKNVMFLSCSEWYWFCYDIKFRFGAYAFKIHRYVAAPFYMYIDLSLVYIW